jgi:DNA-binding NarL/FixJ family response regulator
MRSTQPDVALLDWDLPGLPPDRDLRRLRKVAPGCQFVILSSRPEQQSEAMRAGAHGFVCKGDAPDSLLAVIRGMPQ